MFHIRAEIPLASPDAAAYRGLAYDACRVVLTRPCAQEAVRMNPCTGERECFPTCRAYTCLCRDSDQGCYWAASGACPSLLFKLNGAFCEIDCVRLSALSGCIRPLQVESLSYDCCNKQVLVASTAGVFRFDASASGAAALLPCACRDWSTAVLSLCPYCLCVCRPHGKRQVLRLYLGDELMEQWDLPQELTLEAAALTGCDRRCSRCRVDVLARRHCRYPVLLRCELDCSALCPPICPCNCPPPCPKPPCPSPQRACTDLLESVALMEASLAHILNAEGEKLQKAIACAEEPCELLDINRSVNAALVNATHLEQVLYHKLESIKELCSLCGENDCPPCC